MRKTINQFHNVHLRTWDSSDIEGYANLLSDPETMKYISAGTIRDHNAATKEIYTFQQEIAKRGWSRWAVSLGANAPFIGYSGFAEKECGINFGARYLSEYWGTPYPMAANCLALEYGFKQLKFEKIHLRVNINHKYALNNISTFLLQKNPTGTIVNTPFGPHLKIVVTHKKFMEVFPHNIARVRRILERTQKTHHQRLLKTTSRQSQGI